MSNWELRTIESLCINITSGGTPSRKKPHFYENGTIPWIKTGELDGWYIEDAEEYITEEALANSSAKLFPPETILMAMYGQGDTITNVAILRKEAATNQACCAMIVDESVCNPHFLLYALKHSKESLLKLALGASQRNLSGTKIKSFKIKVPPIETQRKIAAVLSAYDDLIENNTRRIKALEEAAQSLYREWFVEFRYPGHEDVPLVESELGMIPQGWEVVPFGKLSIDLIDGDRSNRYPKNEDLRDSGFLFLNTKNLADGRLDLSDVSFVSPEKFSEITKGRVLPLDVLMSTRGSIGKIALFDSIEYDTGLINAQMLIMRAKNGFSPYFLYHLSISTSFQAGIRSFASGSAQPQIPKRDLSQIPILCPPASLIAQFTDFASENQRAITVLQRENQILREARDGLLPRLVSGAVTVESLDILLGEPKANQLLTAL